MAVICRGCGKSRKTTGVPAQIRTRYLPNVSYKSYRSSEDSTLNPLKTLNLCLHEIGLLWMLHGKNQTEHTDTTVGGKNTVFFNVKPDLCYVYR